MARIFISYSHKDSTVVMPVVDALEQEGHQVDIDKEFLEAGDRLVPEIEKRIHQSDFVLVFLSRSSAKRKWVGKEVFEALKTELQEGKAKIIPCIINRPSSSIFPDAFTKHPAYERLYLDFSDPSEYDDAIKTLLERIRKNKSTGFDGEEYMILDIDYPKLEIYLTGPNLSWEKNSRFMYAEALRSYVLFGFKRDNVGIYFKHFAVCKEKEAEKIRDIISSHYEVTGVGSRDNLPGKWRIWFCLRDYPIVSAAKNNKWTN